MEVAKLIGDIQFDVLIHREVYKLPIEAATIILLCYIGFTDFQTLKIQNLSIILLLTLYVPYAALLRSRYEIALNILLALVIFGVSLGFYARKLIGGGDVKLLSATCLWLGTRCAFLFSIALLVFVALHLAAKRMGWVHTNSPGTIPFGPALAAALITTILLGCA
jgi:prepilin peptidase CpaA